MRLEQLASGTGMSRIHYEGFRGHSCLQIGFNSFQRRILNYRIANRSSLTSVKACGHMHDFCVSPNRVGFARLLLRGLIPPAKNGASAAWRDTALENVHGLIPSCGD